MVWRFLTQLLFEGYLTVSTVRPIGELDKSVHCKVHRVDVLYAIPFGSADYQNWPMEIINE